MLRLPRRGYLTIKHHGWGTFLFRLVTFPLRATRLEKGMRARRVERGHLRHALAWHANRARPVTIVIPTYGDPEVTLKCVRRVKRTVRKHNARIVVVDDGSAPEHQERLRSSLRGVELDLAPENRGYAASVNRGLRQARDDDDVVVMNSDILPHRHWLEALQYGAYREEGVGIAGPRLIYPDGRIQSGGSYRNQGAPEWFDHRYRFMPQRFGPALVPVDALAVTGACMYVTRAALDDLGPMDEAYPMGYEDVDWCLRAWEAGWRVMYEPAALLTHLESVTRGTEVGVRERASQERFWTRWGDRFDMRQVRTADGALRVIYVTEDTGVGGGHRDVFEHANRLRRRGHDVEVWSLGGEPDWFPLEAPVRSFDEFEDLALALRDEDAIKVATWWLTSEPVWRASAVRGVPLYFVQDIETSYYGNDEPMQHRVIASYREEFRYMTISAWNRDRLREFGREAELISPGLDLDTFRPLDHVERRDDVVLALGRSNPLKNLPLTVRAWRRLRPRPELWMFGIEPEIGARYGVRYVTAPSDEGVNELLNEATVLVQTSTHEGFALPPLEAMAAGAAVVCTDAHGNRDFCRHGENCLMVEPRAEAVAAAIDRVLRDRDLRARLVAAGYETAREYAWERRIDELEAFLDRVAASAAAPAEAR
jgi:GT2 family glycosyltransferase/glycosyltransferase involved in cell wall biosynthesis